MALLALLALWALAELFYLRLYVPKHKTRPELRFRALLTKGGADRLELARA